MLERVSWTVGGRRRIGLVGPNGAGKTTLLRLITGELTPDEGSVSTGRLAIGYLRQETHEEHTERTVIEEALRAFDEVFRLEDEERRLVARLDDISDLKSGEYASVFEELDRVHHRLHHLDSHLIRPRAESVLAGLGFETEGFERPLGSYSGGWRMRASLARLLLSDPDLLLLDEPTNHLDIDSIDWLEQYLRAFDGSVIIVSHDRYFLDRMVTDIAEISGHRLTEYAGNYTFYLNEREERRRTHRATWENQQKMIADTERFIERFRAKASKARQVQSRIRMLEKLERVPEPPTEETEISFRFPEPPRSNRLVAELSAFSKSYESAEGSIQVFRDTGPLVIERGDHIALIGQNGAGKSTLARILLGTEPFEGTRVLGSKTELTFFAQNQAETLPPERTVYEVIQESAYGRSETWIRTLLGTFLFHGDDVFKKVSVLSGGERSRVALAKTLVSRANFLILDEPTNHLDIVSRQVLVEALRRYEGTFLVVSHDRHFLDRVAKKVWRAEHGGVREFHGNYSDYLWQIRHGTAGRMETKMDGRPHSSGDSKRNAVSSSPQDGTTVPTSPAGNREMGKKEDTTADGGHENELEQLNDYQLKRLLKKTEDEIGSVEAEHGEVEARTLDPALFEDVEEARRVTARLGQLQANIEHLYDTWSRIAQERENRGANKGRKAKGRVRRS